MIPSAELVFAVIYQMMQLQNRDLQQSKHFTAEQVRERFAGSIYASRNFSVEEIQSVFDYNENVNQTSVFEKYTKTTKVENDVVIELAYRLC